MKSNAIKFDLLFDAEEYYRYSLTSAGIGGVTSSLLKLLVPRAWYKWSEGCGDVSDKAICRETLEP